MLLYRGEALFGKALNKPDLLAETGGLPTTWSKVLEQDYPHDEDGLSVSSLTDETICNVCKNLNMLKVLSSILSSFNLNSYTGIVVKKNVIQK